MTISERMQELHLRDEHVALACRVSSTAVYRWRVGLRKPNTAVLCTLARVLQWSVDDVLRAIDPTA